MGHMHLYHLKTVFIILLALLILVYSKRLMVSEVEDIIEMQREVKAEEAAKKNTAPPSTPTAIQAGQRTYEFSCAICHGLDARGDGIFAKQIVRTPSDLTLLSKKNNGAFPFRYAYDVIDGRQLIDLHGTREMPIWGEQLSFSLWLDVPPEMVETAIRGQIFELLLYLETLQR